MVGGQSIRAESTTLPVAASQVTRRLSSRTAMSVRPSAENRASTISTWGRMSARTATTTPQTLATMTTTNRSCASV